jgi:hypothetical protein
MSAFGKEELIESGGKLVGDLAKELLKAGAGELALAVLKKLLQTLL